MEGTTLGQLKTKLVVEQSAFTSQPVIYVANKSSSCVEITHAIDNGLINDLSGGGLFTFAI